MAQELKVRIKQYVVIEAKLMQLNAQYVGESSFVDTYFHQEPGVVLKIIEDKSGNTILHLKADGGKFQIVRREFITDIESHKNELKKKHGVKKVLSGKRISYNLGEHKITLCLIDDVGEFLILTSEDPKEEVIVKTLGIQNPEYVRVSFDEVAPTK
jgi:adenylate cyclase class IV